ncbi:hypothetical protein KEM54_001278 [Ascosphaera aggregata]|nr:hypothetical protein KEM54_001278 [Ascosphaera aggregata]
MPLKSTRGRQRGRGRGRRGGSGKGRGGPRKTSPSKVISLDDPEHNAIKTSEVPKWEEENREETDTVMADITKTVSKTDGALEPSPEPMSSADEDEKERRERQERIAEVVVEEGEEEEEEEEEEKKKTRKKKTSTQEDTITEDVQTRPSSAQVESEEKPHDNDDSVPRKRRCVSASYKEPMDRDDDVSINSPISAKHQQTARRIQPTPVQDTGKKEVLTAPERRRSAPRRTARKGKWDENNLVTSAKSPLVNIDLVKLLAHPGAWTCLTELEKREILSLLPECIHPDYVAHAHEPDYIIPPLPDSFLRYSNAWRDSVRQFQSDLELGRYTPKWQRDAAEASQQRALGMFDDFKERQFEEFWGQKQKLDKSLIAGESSKIKLETLVRAGVIKIGDIWKYARLIKREKHGKETGEEVIGIDDGALNFIVPPGKRVFLTQSAKDTIHRKPEDSHEEKAVLADSQTQADYPASQSSAQHERRDQPLEIPSDKASDGEYKSKQRPRTRAERNGSGHNAPTGILKSANKEVTSYTIESGEIVYENITTPNQLGNRILEEDGRIKEPPNGNAWKDYRCYRNNQDMGSLWEVRHLWYTRTH